MPSETHSSRPVSGVCAVKNTRDPTAVMSQMSAEPRPGTRSATIRGIGSGAGPAAPVDGAMTSDPAATVRIPPVAARVRRVWDWAFAALRRRSRRWR